jgi:hypothetical protein
MSEKNQGVLGVIAATVAAEAGLPVPGEGLDIRPVIQMVEDINVVALRLGKQCAHLAIFRKGESLVFFSDDGEEVICTARRFRSWINQWVTLAYKFDRTTGSGIPGTLGVDDAATVLECESFLRCIRKVRRVARVRMPVMRAPGVVELLPVGYDEETETFTLNGPVIDETMTLLAAQEWFENVFGGFPFNGDRDRAVHVGAMLAVFCQLMMPRMSLRPGFLWMANKPGSGKSVLAKAALYPVFGKVSSAKLKSGEELDKELEAFSRAAVPYIFLDNIYGELRSAALDQLLTSCFTMGRAMGGHAIFEAENRALICGTGNNLTLNDDAYRRFLIVDLFEKGDPAERRFAGVRLDDSRMSGEEYRASALSALWAMVRAWRDGGCKPGEKRLASYEEFSEVIGGIAWAAGFEDPFQPPDAAQVISPEKAEFNQLVRELIAVLRGEGVLTRDFTLEELARIARGGELFSNKVGTAAEGRQLTIRQDGLKGDLAAMAEDCGYLDAKQRQRWVFTLKPHAGSEPVVDGVKVQFGKRIQQRKTCFSISILE